MFLNQKQLRQDIADIVMGEITRSGYSEQVKGGVVHASWIAFGSTADSEETCAAMALSDRVAERILEQYMLVLPIEEEVTND